MCTKDSCKCKCSCKIKDYQAIIIATNNDNGTTASYYEPNPYDYQAYLPQFDIDVNPEVITLDGNNSFAESANVWALNKIKNIIPTLQNKHYCSHDAMRELLRDFPVWRFINITDASQPPQSCLIDVLSMVKEITGKKYVPETDQWYNLDKPCCNDSLPDEEYGCFVRIWDKRHNKLFIVNEPIHTNPIDFSWRVNTKKRDWLFQQTPIQTRKEFAIAAIKLAKEVLHYLSNAISLAPGNPVYYDYIVNHPILQINLVAKNINWVMNINMYDILYREIGASISYCDRLRKCKFILKKYDPDQDKLKICYHIGYIREFNYHSPECWSKNHDNCSSVSPIRRRMSNDNHNDYIGIIVS